MGVDVEVMREKCGGEGGGEAQSTEELGGV